MYDTFISEAVSEPWAKAPIGYVLDTTFEDLLVLARFRQCVDGLFHWDVSIKSIHAQNCEELTSHGTTKTAFDAAATVDDFLRMALSSED